jgi:hypothetical protein
MSQVESAFFYSFFEFFISPNRFKYTIFVINEKQNKKHIYPIHGVCRFGELSCVCVL